MSRPTVLLAFSGGLDTSRCVLHLRGDYDVVTCTVDTGGATDEDHAAIEHRSQELGAVAHHRVDARADFFEQMIIPMVQGNVLRGGTYPLCVGAERVLQATRVATLAHDLDVQAVAHGSTGAGNDQVRFDVALRAMTKIPLLAPVREHNWKREEQVKALEEAGFDAPPLAEYSINRGMWGTTIGGKETNADRIGDDAEPIGSWSSLPLKAFEAGGHETELRDEPEEMVIGFSRGVPASLDGEAMDGVTLVESLAARADQHGVGRGVHLGTTMLGTKGRVGFAAPAAITIISAHRELEKLVLTKAQLELGVRMGDALGILIHEGRYLDPAVEDLRAFFHQHQSTVVGEVRVRLSQGHVDVLGYRSPFSLLGRGASYGEEAQDYDGRDAEGFCRVLSLEPSGVVDGRQAAGTAAADMRAEGWLEGVPGES